MTSALIHCPKCQTALLDGVFNRNELSPCPSCQSPLQIEVFPAMFRSFTPGTSGDALMADSEASCFYHPQKKAVLPCDGCGRFLCALCDCELKGQHLCPACLEAGRTRGKIKHLENARIRYDNIAFALAVWPVLFFYLSFITAPMALYVVIRYWKAPLGLTQRSRAKLAAAGIIGALVICAWVVFLIALFTKNG